MIIKPFRVCDCDIDKDGVITRSDLQQITDKYHDEVEFADLVGFTNFCYSHIGEEVEDKPSIIPILFLVFVVVMIYVLGD